MKKLIGLFFIIFLIISCEENKSYQVVFNLQNYIEKHYDLYNPILNTFKVDSLQRKEHPKYYDFDAYYSEDTLKLFFYSSGSYGYLHQIFYNDIGLIDKIKVFPILGNSIDKNANILTSKFFYENDKLRIIKDMLGDELIFIDADYATIYKGLIESNTFKMYRIKCCEYFKKNLL